MVKKLPAFFTLEIVICLAMAGLIYNASVITACCDTRNINTSVDSLIIKKEECKEIIAMNPTTMGEYNLHMKIRDPSRHGVQVLFICEPGYQYTYQHPQTGQSMAFTVEHRIIGTTSINDQPPDIMKPGMVLTDCGISYGTNDCPSLMYTNPGRYAWDDFDWIRYAYQIAETEDEAVELLTKDAVDDLHATAIGETLYVVGPHKGFAIEADAYNYHVEEIKELYIKSNYPEFLWDVCSSDQYKYAPHFETIFDDWAREHQVIKLGAKCALGVTITQISKEQITAKAFPGNGEEVTVNMGENKSLGNFRVGLIATSGSSDTPTQQQKRAHITICYKYLEWRNRMYDIMNQRIGEITLSDLMTWSRLHSDDLNGLRGFCEGDVNDEEAVNIFRHPINEPGLMSSLWFSGIPCCSVYAPVHICVKDIYEPYKSGAAWEITLELLENYGHDALPFRLNRIENVIINENDNIESIGYELLQNGKNTTVIDILTFSDTMLQCHAFKMEQILLNLSKIIGTSPILESTGDIDIDSVINIIDTMWSIDYITSLKGMKQAVIELKVISGSLESNSDSGDTDIIYILDGIKCEILDIMRTAAWYKIREAECIVGQKDSDLKEAKRIYQDGVDEINNEHFTNAAEKFLKAFEVANCMVIGEPYPWQEEEQIWTMQSYMIVSTVIILVVILCAIVRFRKKNERFKE